MTDEMFTRSWEDLKKNKKDKYKFLFGGGDQLKEVCKKICKKNCMEDGEISIQLESGHAYPTRQRKEF